VALHEKFRISGQRELNDQFLRRIHKALRPDHSIVLWAAKKGYDPLFMQHERIMPLLNAPAIDPAATSFITALRTNEANSGGYTPVHYLAQRGHRGALDCIMTLDASLEDCITPRYEKPLHIALQNGHMDVFLFFFYRMHTQPAWHAPTKYGDTLLHHVALAGDLDFLQKLETFLGKGAKISLVTRDTINAVNQEGNAPTHCASQKGSWELLINLSRRNSYTNPPGNKAGRGIFEEGIFFGNSTMIDHLYDSTFSDQSPQTQLTELQQHLWWAMAGNQPAMVEKLLKLGASCNKLVTNPTTTVSGLPLREAAYLGHSAVVTVLLKHGAKVNAKGPYSRTALVEALYNNDPATVKVLINAGADVNQLVFANRSVEGVKTTFKMPCLSYAAASSYIDIIELLVSAGADIEAKDDTYNKTPLEWALAEKRKIAINRLLTRGAQIPNQEVNDKIMALFKAAQEHGDEAEKQKRNAAANATT